LPNAVPAAIAITGSMIAGIATVEALFRVVMRASNPSWSRNVE
jgi:hypothetical protein